MKTEEFNFLNKKILIEKRDEVDSHYKISSYKNKLDLMEEKKIPQKPIIDILNHFFLKNKLVSDKTKKSISKIIYSHKDKIIILITKSGREIIWKRDKLIHEYGWFFFVSKRDTDSISKKIKKEEKKAKKREITINIENYHFDSSSIVLKEKQNMRPLYHTKEYFQYFKLITSKNVPQLPIKEVLDNFFNNYEEVPIKEKKAIRKIIFYQNERVIVVKCLIGDLMYKNLEELVKKYGWYFYITGVPVGESDISNAIDKIDKRFDLNYFKNLSLSEDTEKIRVSIYPIVLKPNHNCHILGLGKLNILLASI